MTFIKRSVYAFLLPMMAGMTFAHSAVAATTASTEFRAVIVGGACDISVPAIVPVNKGAVIPSEDIIAGNSPVESFDLTLSGCKGYGLTPEITLEGDVNSASGMPLFLTNSSTTKGYGILLTFDGNSNFKTSNNLAEDLKLAAADKTWSTTATSVLNGTIPLKAAVSCGDCAADADIQGGELKANVTFKFAYN